MNRTLNLSGIKKDLLGGLSTAVVSVPGNIVFGIIAFAPLGSEYMAQGILAGMYSSIFLGLCTGLFGGTPGMISGPKAPGSLVFGGLIASLIASRYFNLNGQAPTILIIAYMAVFLSGVMQTVFGFLRFGSLIKFIPYPVVAGFLNGAAILIIFSQIWTFLGIPKQDSLSALWTSIPRIQPFSALIGAVAALVMWRASKITEKIPGSILGLIIGSALYYILMGIGLGNHLGALIGDIPVALPTPHYLQAFAKTFISPDFLRWVPLLIPAAFTMAVLGSIESLLASLSMQGLVYKRSDANRELMGQGIGNMVASFFGGLPGAGNAMRTILNYQAGGRTGLSNVCHALIIFLIIFFLSPLIEMIPKAAAAGIVIVMAFLLFDRWSIQLLKDIAHRKNFRRKDLLVNFFIVLLVMLATILFNLVVAVGLGIAVSILSFVAKMSKSVIRRSYKGSNIHSKKQRDEKLMQILRDYGNRIHVLELEGVIFFGTADRLANEIEQIAQDGSSYIILDMKRVNDIDSTGSRILKHAYLQLRKQKKRMAVSYLEKGGPLWQFLELMGLIKDMGVNTFFIDTDMALEHFEDLLLREILSGDADAEEASLENLDILQGLSEDELKIVRRFLHLEHYDHGDLVFRQGEKSNALFCITKGAADITIQLPDTRRKKRLATLSAGTIFGEMALLDDKPRSANVEVKEPLTCYRLALEDFERLKQDFPNISIIIATNIGRIMASRLRFANEMISELEM
ncbi:MAG: SLC26A/SulP transporter family protein [Deltaproteobacteria bacterium]|nr:SLC26A/SulP transporter family protein [Deltaproteobacteria bacterium]